MDALVGLSFCLPIALLPMFLIAWLEMQMEVRVPHVRIAWIALIAFFVPPAIVVTVIVAVIYPPLILIPIAFPVSSLIWRLRLEDSPWIRRFLTSVNLIIIFLITLGIIKNFLEGRFWPEIRM